MAWFKKRTKDDVKATSPITHGVTKAGKPAIVGTKVEFKDGTVTTLLTPNGKAAKFAEEQKTGVRMTNDGGIKLKDGLPMQLTEQGKAYRGGYLDAMKDIAKAYSSRELRKLRRQQDKAARKAAKDAAKAAQS